MSCGLGAIILVFMLVKHKVDVAHPEVDALEQELAELRAAEDTLSQQIARAMADRMRVESNADKAKQTLTQSQKDLAVRQREAADQQAQLARQQAEIERTEVAEVSDVIENSGVGEETYVMGLKVEGRKIGILIDSSASMTDEVLIDVIRRKNSSDTDKQAGPKWQRTKRIGQWLLARLPKSSSVKVIAYNDQTQTLGPDGWVGATDNKGLGDILGDMDGLVPSGATDLQAGLKLMKAANPSDVYVVTDGLPTQGDSNYKSLNPFASCSALWGQASTISGECRLKLFNHTVQSTSFRPGVPVNVVLLPIEGDPQASVAYWSWTSTTGGLLISPAVSWP